HFHDSFYMRMTIGAGYLFGKQTYEPNPNIQIFNPGTGAPSAVVPTSSEVGVHGWTTSFDILLGGTPVNGFVVGGGLIFNSAPEPTAVLGDTSVTSDSSFVLWLPSMFVDVFPDPSKGFHFGAIAGIAIVDWEKRGTGSTASGVGGG